MRAGIRHVAVGLGLVVASVGSACSAPQDTCAELRADLKRCGLSATSLDCTRVDTSTLESMVSRFSSDGCDGAKETTSADGAVDPRLCQAAGWSCPEIGRASCRERV